MRSFSTFLMMALAISACQISAASHSQPLSQSAPPSAGPSAKPSSSVSASASASASSSMTVSNSPSASPTASTRPVVSLDTDFSLNYRQPVLIGSEKLEISFQDLIQESRCPRDVMCGVAGDVTVRFKLNQNGTELGQPALRLGFGEVSAVVENYRLTWVKVKPETILSTEKPAPSDYVLTVRVSKDLGTLPGQLNQPFTLKQKQSASIASEKLKLTYAALLEDSRCPEDAQCIWAGQIRVQIEIIQDGGNPQNVELTWQMGSDKPTAIVGKYRLSLLSVGDSQSIGLLVQPAK